ncbi:MAG TPA: polyprenol monophosphomannose synthase [Solirubrobacteraceae bacterium]
MTTPRTSWLVLPTYNEVENLEALVRSALPVLRASAPGEAHVLIVDDCSPDGTGLVADRLAAEFEEVHVLHRGEKGGLGQAYLAGFEAALEFGAGYVLEMDCDFSHDPAELARLLAAAEGGADVVLGSRYVQGGGTVLWSAGRRALSRAGCWYARRLLGLRLWDLTGGFKCFRREVLEAIDLPSVRSKGYAFQVELTYRAARRGFVIQEVPILFRDRQEGASKMSTRIVAEAMLRVPALRFAERQGAPGVDVRLGHAAGSPRPV